MLETLLEKRLVKIAGRKDAPGRPMVYETTDEFLELFGLKDLEGLPDLSEFREIERAVEQANTGPVEGIETHPEDAAIRGSVGNVLARRDTVRRGGSIRRAAQKIRRRQDP